MCLVCIAFASWVLKSSDPEALMHGKQVRNTLLANVSALSAIQYLRHGRRSTQYSYLIKSAHTGPKMYLSKSI
uniref:Uncharacterized protein n=1 Tax=Neogobius melanostomus TaxID=47308 RepID=A0A8C6T7U7_9GOBI